MLTSRYAGAALLAVLASGCLSGQTGSPDCEGPHSCVCDTLYSGGALLRLHRESMADGRMVAVVDEVLGSVFHPTDIRVGERISGEIAPARPCDQQAPATTQDSELFALFAPGATGGYPQCDSESKEVCAELREASLMEGTYRFLIPWEEQLDFGAEHRLPRREVAALTSLETCWEQFPLGPTPPCDDTQMVCSLQSPAPSSHGWRWLGAISGLVLLGLARRRAA